MTKNNSYTLHYLVKGCRYRRETFTKSEWETLRAYCPEKVSSSFQRWKDEMERQQELRIAQQKKEDVSVESVTIPWQTKEEEIRFKVASRDDFIDWLIPESTNNSLFKKLTVAKCGLEDIVKKSSNKRDSDLAQEILNVINEV
jgi:hypothetical protein